MLTHLLKIMLLQIFAAIGLDESWLNLIPEELRLIFPLVLFFVNLIALAIVLYLAGLIVVGKKRSLISDAFIISLLGNILSTAFFILIPYRILALALSIIVWLLLIKRFYETTWLKAMAVGVLAIIVFLAITVLLALIFGILAIILERFFLLTIPIP